jgi:hypothetical protein
MDLQEIMIKAVAWMRARAWKKKHRQPPGWALRRAKSKGVQPVPFVITFGLPEFRKSGVRD